jgi:hypothetical protein
MVFDMAFWDEQMAGWRKKKYKIYSIKLDHVEYKIFLRSFKRISQKKGFRVI